MKQYIKALALGLLTAGMLTSCDDFLDRPAESSYNADNFYQTSDQCYAGVNYLYNSPWYDFQRGFIKVGEVMSGNYYWGSSPYLNFSVNGNDEDLKNMSYSLWAVIGHSNTVYNSLKKSPADPAVVNQCMGECLTWKALAYFFLARSFGDVPIIHDTSETLGSGTYNNIKKVHHADVYDYIILTLEKAMSLMEKKNNSASGRLDYYSAEALLAKTYLTKAGVTGTLNQEDLDKAASYAKDVIENSGYSLMENYGDLFKLAYNKNSECLISWRWVASGSNWTRQNTLQDDLAMTGFGSQGGCWGGWNGCSVDLQEAFDVYQLERDPSSWNANPDTRLKATMMLPGFSYDYFRTDKGGFDYLTFIYTQGSTGELESPNGANCVKHIYGTTADHIAGCGEGDDRMASSLATHILRLADVYLVLAESKLHGPGSSTTDPDALAAYNTVHQRAVKNATPATSLTWEQVWKERRLELAMEGDRWYDYVRVSYYNPDFCVNELKNQHRGPYYGLNSVYKAYFESGNTDWSVTSSAGYDTGYDAPNVEALMRTDAATGKKYFYLPMCQDDVIYNPNLASTDDEGNPVEPERVDIRATYSY